MSTFEVIGIVLSVMLGLRLLAYVLVAVATRIQAWLVSRADYCELCKKRPRAFVCSLSSGRAPFNICTECCEREVYEPLRKEWLKNGKLVPAGVGGGL